MDKVIFNTIMSTYVYGSSTYSQLFFIFKYFFDNTAEEGERKQGEREGERHAAKGLRPGVELRSAAARTKTLYMEACTTANHEHNILKNVTRSSRCITVLFF